MKELLKKHYGLDIVSIVKSSVGAGSDYQSKRKMKLYALIYIAE